MTEKFDSSTVTENNFAVDGHISSSNLLVKISNNIFVRHESDHAWAVSVIIFSTVQTMEFLYELVAWYRIDTFVVWIKFVS